MTTNLDTARTDQQIEEQYRAAHDPKRAAQAEDNLVMSAWGTAVLVPLVGFVLGTILVTRQREAHGIWAMIVSTVMALVWWAAIAAIRA